MLSREYRNASVARSSPLSLASWVFTTGLRIGSMVFPGLAANGGTRDEHDNGTSGKNADDDVEMFVAVDELPVGVFLSSQLLFCFDAPFFFSGGMAE